MRNLKNSTILKGLALILCCTLLVLARTEKPDAENGTATGQALLQELERVLRLHPHIESFQGLQVPGTGLVLSTRVKSENPLDLRALVEESLGQISLENEALMDGEKLIWLLTGPTAEMGFQCPLNGLSQRLSYQFVEQNMRSSTASQPSPARSPGTIAGEREPQRLLSSPWLPLGGDWEITEDVYLQKQLGHYDLVSYCRTQLEPPFTLKSDLKYIEGEMGGGLIFGASDSESKSGATMVSFTAGGGFLQCGHFNDQGVFVFQDGRPVLSVSDGAWHQLSVEVLAESYHVSLDGQKILENIPLKSELATSFAGLFVSTSRVAFRNITCESQ